MTTSLLVVDDHDMFREQLSLALRAKGYEVIEAAEGTIALDLAERRQPHLALVDVRMPGMDGIDLVRALQDRVRTSKLPVILMTANARREDIAMGTSLGIRDFLLKSSFSVDELVGRIETRLHAAVPAPPAPPSSIRDSGALPRSVLREPGSAPARRSAFDPPSSAPGSSAPSTPPSSAFGAPSGFPGADVQESGLFGKAQSRILPVQELRALPAPVAEIQRLAASNTASLSQVQSVIRRDPVLAERVISASNTLGMRGTSPVENLEDSLRVLGVEQMVRVVASQPVFTAAELSGQFGAELAQLWMHGIATAVFSERLAPAAERSQAFLQGLFHVLPAMVALQSLGDQWHELAMQARKEGRSGIDALALSFGKPASVFAEEILGRMRLPEGIHSVLREWYRDRLRRGSKTASDACRRVDAAASLATGCGLAWSDLSSLRPIAGEEARSWSGSDTLEIDLPSLRRHVRTLQRSAGLPEPVDESVLGGLWGADDILYWRDSRFRAPDPIELALVDFKAKRIESPEALLEEGGAMGVACAEPGSPWWSALIGSPRPMLVIHCSPAPSTATREHVRLLHAPVPLYLLHEALERS